MFAQDNIEMPEAPKQGFLKGLFGGGPRPLDREELFGEASGKASTSLAKSVPGAAGLAALQVRARALQPRRVGGWEENGTSAVRGRN
jgi:hypothetical protein